MSQPAAAKTLEAIVRAHPPAQAHRPPLRGGRRFADRLLAGRAGDA